MLNGICFRDSEGELTLSKGKFHDLAAVSVNSLGVIHDFKV